MVNEHYSLKHSRLSIVFQLLLLMLIAVVMFLTFTVGIALICVLAMFAAWRWFNRAEKLHYLQQLDHSEWSLKFENQSTTYRVRLEKMVQHHFYIVVYFQNKKHKPVIIWKDQLDQIAWKALLTRCHLN